MPCMREAGRQRRKASPGEYPGERFSIRRMRGTACGWGGLPPSPKRTGPGGLWGRGAVAYRYSPSPRCGKRHASTATHQHATTNNT